MLEKRQKVLNKVDTNSVTKQELKYAKKMGIELPEEITNGDAKAIIANYLDDDVVASEGIQRYAEQKGMNFSKYIGQKALYTQLYDNLELDDKIIFFIFTIYNFYSGDEDTNLLEHKYYKKFEELKDELIKDGLFLTSIEEDYIGEDLVVFGTAKREVNGKMKTIYGGPNGTRGHNTVLQRLKSEGIIAN